MTLEKIIVRPVAGLIRVAFVVTAFAVLASSAMSQSASSSFARAASVELEERGRQILARHLEPRRFQVFAQVEAAAVAAAADSPYLPAAGGGPAKALDNWMLREALQKVELTVYIDPKVQPAARAKLQELLVRGLALRPDGGDQIVFSDLVVPAADGPEGAVAKASDDKALRAIQDDLRALKFRNEDLLKERNDLSRDLSLARLESTRRAADPKASVAAPAAGAAGEGAVSAAAVPPASGLSPAWVNGGVGSLLAVALLVGLLLVGGSFRALGKSMATAVSAIAQALENLGGSLTPKESATRTQVDVRSGATQAPEGVARSRVAHESVERRLKDLREVLKTQLAGRGETTALSQINLLLGAPEDVEMGVATLEVLGEEAAHRLFLKLAKPKQTLVVNFLKKGTYSVAKEERLVEAGEKLKMLMFVDSFAGIRGELDGRVIEAMIRIQDRDLADVCAKLPREALSRVLLYCDPARVARVLDLVRTRDEGQYGHLVASVTGIPEARFKANHDEVIHERLSQALTGADSDLQREYLEFYREVVEGSAERLRQDVADRLSTQHPKVKEYLEESILSFQTFFKLAREFQEEVVDYLANRDLAALILNLDENRRGAIEGLLEERRKELLKDDLVRLESKGKRQVEQAFAQASRLVVDKIAKLKGEGSIQDLMAKGAQQKAPLRAA